MATITATDRPISWSVVESSAIIETGMTLLGETTIAANVNTLHSNPDENALMGALATAGVSAPALPEAGAELEQGDIYDYSGTLYMVRQSHTRTEHDPDTVPALFTSYREDAGAALEWVVGEQVYVGTERVHNGTLYTCLQAHQTQSDQQPNAEGITGVLWGVVPATDEWAVGVEYTGDNTAGAGNGDVVTYEGAEYRCLQSHTSQSDWYPTAPGIINVLWVLVP